MLSRNSTNSSFTIFGIWSQLRTLLSQSIASFSMTTWWFKPLMNSHLSQIPFITMVTNGLILFIRWSAAMTPHEGRMISSKLNASSSSIIHHALIGHATSPTDPFQGSSFGAKNLVKNMVDKPCLINRACNSPMIGSVHSHH